MTDEDMCLSRDKDLSKIVNGERVCREYTGYVDHCKYLVPVSEGGLVREVVKSGLFDSCRLYAKCSRDYVVGEGVQG